MHAPIWNLNNDDCGDVVHSYHGILSGLYPLRISICRGVFDVPKPCVGTEGRLTFCSNVMVHKSRNVLISIAKCHSVIPKCFAIDREDNV